MDDEQYAYLEEGFNTRNLKKDELRGILADHGVSYSNEMRKPELYNLFMKEILPRREELRRRFTQAVPSAANIEDATPPRPVSRTRLPPPDPAPRRARSRSPRRAPKATQPPPSVAEVPTIAEEEAPKAENAPKPAARRGSPAKSKATKSLSADIQKELDAVRASPALTEHETPALAPSSGVPVDADAAQEPPLSPRRRRVARRPAPPPEVPEPDLSEGLGDVKLKVSREKRRKRAADTQLDEDESFTSNNVFQSSSSGSAVGGTPRKRVKTAPDVAEPVLAGIKSPRLPKREGTPKFEAPKLDAPKLQHAPTLAHPPKIEDEEMPDAARDEPAAKPFTAVLEPVTEADIGIEIDPQYEQELDMDVEMEYRPDDELVAELAAEVLPAATLTEIPVLENIPILVADLPPSRDATPAEAAVPAAPAPAAAPVAAPVPQAQSSSQASPEPEPVPAAPASPVAAAPTAADIAADIAARTASRAAATPQRTIPTRRRGFVPSFPELSAPRVFTEQLDPFLIPSPAETPAHTPRERSPLGTTPSARASSSSSGSTHDPSPLRHSLGPGDYDVSELPSAEEVAARDIHNALQSIPRVQLPQIPSVRLPEMHLPQIPEVHLPEMHLPEMHLPEIHLPEVHIPEVPRPNWRRFVPSLPRPRLPHIQLPQLRLPRVPRPHMPRVPRPSRAVIGGAAAAVRDFVMVLCVALGTLFSVAVVALGIATLVWMRGVYGQAEFCEVGAYQLDHAYPIWTTFDSGVPAVAQLQANLRDTLDTVWPDCLTCPENAHCYADRVVLCDGGFVQTSPLLQRLGVWPLPPRCVPDWETQRKMDVLAERAAHHLRQRRADVACESGGAVPRDAAETARLSALSTNQLRTAVLAEKADTLPLDEFDALWSQAIDLVPSKFADVYVVSLQAHAPPDQILTPLQLQSSDAAFEADPAAPAAEPAPAAPPAPLLDEVYDADSLSYGDYPYGSHPFNAPIWLCSSSDALMPLRCRFKRSLFVWLQAHVRELLTSTAVIVAFVATVVSVRRWAMSKIRRERLVAQVVTRLRRQRERALEDKAVRPFLPTLELRKSVARADWPAVEYAVERNQSVRVRQVEHYGEIIRIWEWVG